MRQMTEVLYLFLLQLNAKLVSIYSKSIITHATVSIVIGLHGNYQK